MNTRFREGPDGGVEPFSPSLSVGGQAAAILFMLCFFVTISMAQVRQTSLYVDNGSGSFGKIKADSLTAGETFELPASGGTLLTNSGSGFIKFNPADTQMTTNSYNLFNLRDMPTTGAAPGAFMMSSGNSDNSGASTTGLTLFDSSAASSVPLGTVTCLNLGGGYGSNNYGIVLNINGANSTDIQGSGSHWNVSSVGAATFNTSVSTPKLKGAAANHYAELHTVSAAEALTISGNTITISNSAIAGTSSVIIATLSSASGSATFIKSAKATGSGTANITLDALPSSGDVYNLIIVNP